MALDSHQLTHILHGSAHFYGVLPYDKIPTHVRSYPAAYIFNTDPSHLQGQHWVSVYFSEDRTAQYMCSLAVAPYGKLYDFLKCGSYDAAFNRVALQSPISSMCGYYCVLHLLMASRGCELAEFLELFDKKDLSANDELIFRFVAARVSRLLRDGSPYGSHMCGSPYGG